MCSDNNAQADSSIRRIVADFEDAKQLLEHSNVVKLELPKTHRR